MNVGYVKIQKSLIGEQFQGNYLNMRSRKHVSGNQPLKKHTRRKILKLNIFILWK